MKAGKLVISLPEIDDIQRFYNENIKSLPEIYKNLEKIQLDSLKTSEKLNELTNSLKEKHI
jgi:hypothetical protein